MSELLGRPSLLCCFLDNPATLLLLQDLQFIHAKMGRNLLYKFTRHRFAISYHEVRPARRSGRFIAGDKIERFIAPIWHPPGRAKPGVKP